jgi:hypothetical protein
MLTSPAQIWTLGSCKAQELLKCAGMGQGLQAIGTWGWELIFFLKYIRF